MKQSALPIAPFNRLGYNSSFEYKTNQETVKIEYIDGYHYRNGLCVGKHIVEIGKNGASVRVWSKKLQNISWIEERRHYWKNQCSLNWQKHHDKLMEVIGNRSFIGKIDGVTNQYGFIHVQYNAPGEKYSNEDRASFSWSWCENPLTSISRPQDDKFENVPIDNESAQEFWRLLRLQDKSFKPFYLYDICFRTIIDENYANDFGYNPRHQPKSVLVLTINGREYIFSGDHKDAHGYSLGMLCESDEIVRINVP